MKDIIILYKGGSGGFFIYYYLLASDSNIISKLAHFDLGKKKELLDACFYHQFPLNRNLNDWKKSEKWPTNQKVIKNDSRQIFLCCENELTDDLDGGNSIVVNPYIDGKKKWLRIQVTKRCMQFINFPKNNYSRKEFFDFYKSVYKQVGENSKVRNADYFFDFIKFLQDKNERTRLCDFLNIKINKRMEDYLEHYIKCHGDFYNKLVATGIKSQVIL